MLISRVSRMAALYFVLILAGWESAYASSPASTVFQQVAPASALILAGEDEKICVGTGVLIDRQRRLILTAAHVVSNKQTIRVVFPELNNGHLITSGDHYFRDLGRHAVLAKATWVDTHRDLALIQVEQIPLGVDAVWLATSGPVPGDTVFAVGNSSFNLGGLFGIVSGTIRNIYARSWDGVTVIDSTIPTNQGDSGGPVVNAQGELVGIVSIGTTGRQLETDNPLYAKQSLDLSIDVSEIRDFLATVEVPQTETNTDDVSPVILAAEGMAALNQSIAAVESVIHDNDLDDLDELANYEKQNAPKAGSNAEKPLSSFVEFDLVIEGIRIPKGLMADAYYGLQ